MQDRANCTLPKAQNEPLGINTKSSSPETPSDEALAHEIRGLRAERYRLQNTASRLLKHEGQKLVEKGELTYAEDFHRVCKCRRTRVAPTADIHKSKTNGKAFYGGLAICGSVWGCPVCCAKIQERRREEISLAIEWAYRNGLKAVMVTFTFPHYEFQKCADLLEKQAAAFKYLRSGKKYQEFKEEMGYRGLIRSLEVMTGRNGWHPHTHELFFVDKAASASRIKSFLLNRWKDACKKQKLIPWGKMKAFYERAVDVKDQCSNSDYLAKLDDPSHWGIDRELAGSSKKRGGGVHPFALLARFEDHDDVSAGRRFLEYIEAFHGKRQLFWSHGLKDEVGVSELDDKELSEESQDSADCLVRLEHFAWTIVIQNKARSHILDLAETGGYDAVYQWLVQHGYYDYGGCSHSQNSYTPYYGDMG